MSSPASPEPTRSTGSEPEARTLSLQFDLINKCNLRCRMCHFADDNVFYAPRIEMNAEEFDQVLGPILPRVRSAMLSCATEPLMGKSFLDVLKLTRAAGVPFVEFVTNATLFKEQNLAAFFENRVNRIQISMDGARRTTFEDVRVGAKYDIVVRNVRRLTNLKRKLGVAYPTVRMNLVLLLHNITEAVSFVQMAHELGVQELDLRHVDLHPAMGLDDQSLWRHKALSNFHLKHARARAEALGLALYRWPEPFALDEAEQAAYAELEAATTEIPVHADWREVPEYQESASFHVELPAGETGEELADVEEVGALDGEALLAQHRGLGFTAEELERGYRRCPLPFEFSLVSFDGKVSPCPFWTHDGEMGNVKSNSLDQVWRGEPYLALRRSLVTGELMKPCRHCPNLGRGDVNDVRAFTERVF